MTAQGQEGAIKEVVLRLLGDIAPEAALGEIDPKDNLRDQLDIDSIDFLKFIVQLHDTLGVSVPEADYRMLLTLDGCIAYLSERARRGP